MSYTKKVDGCYSGGKTSGKGRFKNYTGSVREAYNYGFRDGYAAYDGVAQKRGAYYAAKFGYMRGLKAHRKVSRYQAKARRGGR